MSATLTRLLGAARGLLGGEAMDYISAGASGVVDGLLLASNRKEATLGFIVKNIAIPLVDGFIMKLPRGLVYHATGQLAMTVTLILKSK